MWRYRLACYIVCANLWEPRCVHGLRCCIRIGCYVGSAIDAVLWLVWNWKALCFMNWQEALKLLIYSTCLVSVIAVIALMSFDSILFHDSIPIAQSIFIAQKLLISPSSIIWGQLLKLRVSRQPRFLLRFDLPIAHKNALPTWKPNGLLIPQLLLSPPDKQTHHLHQYRHHGVPHRNS